MVQNCHFGGFCPLGQNPALRYPSDLRRGRTRVGGYQTVKIFLKICSAVLAQCQRVTQTETHTQAHGNSPLTASRRQKLCILLLIPYLPETSEFPEIFSRKFPESQPWRHLVKSALLQYKSMSKNANCEIQLAQKLKKWRSYQQSINITGRTFVHQKYQREQKRTVYGKS